MIWKNIFAHVLHPAVLFGGHAKLISKRVDAGIDVLALQPTARMNEAAVAERYKTGRVAEMTERQAGL